MTKRMREVKAVVSEITEDFEIGYTGGGHIQIILTRGNARRKLVTGSTPSDHRALTKFRCDVRREYAKMSGRA